jgi:hypothetical protein
VADDDKKQTAVWSKPSRPKEGLTEEQMLDALESALEAREEKGKPEGVARFAQWKRDAWAWLWWTVKNEPTRVIVWLASVLFGSTMAINYVVDEGFVDPEDFPFATQRQHGEALCEVRAGRIEVCALRVAVGQIDGPCPSLPDSCPSSAVME